MLLLLLVTLQAATVVPEWTLSETRDAVTDLPVASASLRSISGSERLVVRCDGAGEPVVSVQFLPRRYLGISGSRSVTVRIDELPPVETEWERGSQGTFNREPEVVRSLANLIARAHRVVVRAWNYENQPIDGIFQVAGGEPRLRRVFELCGYSFDQASK